MEKTQVEAWDVGSRVKRWVPERAYTTWPYMQILEHFLPYHTEFSLLFHPFLIAEVQGLVTGLGMIKSRAQSCGWPCFFFSMPTDL